MPDQQKPSTQAHREAIAALPRPDLISGLDSKGIATEARRVREIDTTTRVYRKDWLFDTRHDDVESARAHFDAKYAGRVLEEDWHIVPPPIGKGVFLEIRRPNILGEFKHAADADKCIQEQPDPDACQAVTRNSRAEHLLMDYAIKRLVIDVKP